MRYINLQFTLHYILAARGFIFSDMPSALLIRFRPERSMNMHVCRSTRMCVRPLSLHTCFAWRIQVCT